MKWFYPKGYEECYLLKWIIDNPEDFPQPITLFEAKRVFFTNTFWCTKLNEAGVSGESDCGRDCRHYDPRNHKSGRCRFSEAPLDLTTREFLLENNKLTLIKT